jgi:hypothetical protein
MSHTTRVSPVSHDLWLPWLNSTCLICRVVSGLLRPRRFVLSRRVSCTNRAQIRFLCCSVERIGALAGQLSSKKSSSTGLYNLIIVFSHPPDNQPARLSPTAQQHVPPLAGRRLPSSRPADP